MINSSKPDSANASIAIAALLLATVAGAAPFQNLGFEEARTNSSTPVSVLGPPFFPGAGIGPINDLLPGWRLFAGDQEITTMGFNYPNSIQSKYQTVFNMNYPGAVPLEGRYGLILTLGYGVVAADPFYYLSQRAEIPAGAQLLTFTYNGRPWIASINGQDVTPTNAFPSVVPTTLMGDISQFAGQTVDLTFRTTPPVPVGGGESAGQIDAIAFVVPEPSTFALFIVGIYALAGRLMWRRFT